MGMAKIFKIGPKMAVLRAFFVNLSKIPDEPLEVVFAHCASEANAIGLRNNRRIL